jgi:phosphoribosylformylglycinamidine synthase subunit PurL
MVRTNTIVLPGHGRGVVRVKGTRGRWRCRSTATGASAISIRARRDARRGRGGAQRGLRRRRADRRHQQPELRQPRAARDHVAVRRGHRRHRRGLPRARVPITGGNVSLYNETDGQAIYPTPVLGVVGLIEDAVARAGAELPRRGDDIVLLGEGFGGARRQRVPEDACTASWRGRRRLDLERERALQRLLVRAASRRACCESAHDCADGRLAVRWPSALRHGGLGVDGRLARGGGPAPATRRRCSASRPPARRVGRPGRTLARGAALARGAPRRAGAVIGRTGGDRADGSPSTASGRSTARWPRPSGRGRRRSSGTRGSGAGAVGT